MQAAGGNLNRLHTHYAKMVPIDMWPSGRSVPRPLPPRHELRGIVINWQQDNRRERRDLLVGRFSPVMHTKTN